MRREASWQLMPGGRRHRGGEDPPCLLRGQHPALWNTAVGQTKSFQPTWWKGEGGGTAAGLFPFTERSQRPRLCLTAFTCIASLAVHRNGGRPYCPHFSDEETEALKAWPLAPGHAIRTLTQQSQSAMVLGWPLAARSGFQARVREAWSWCHKAFGGPRSRGARSS